MQNLPRYHPLHLLATGFGSGYLPVAPGTWGTLATVPPAFLLMYFCGPFSLAFFAIALTGLGVWSANWYEKKTGRHDPGEVVIDEMATISLVLLLVPFSPLWWILAVAVFRVFDTLKPQPINWMDSRIGGGAGVMADDLAAGAISTVVLVLLQILFAAPLWFFLT